MNEFYNDFERPGYVTRTPLSLVKMEPIPKVLENPETYGYMRVGEPDKDMFHWLARRELSLGWAAQKQFCEKHNPTVSVIVISEDAEYRFSYKDGFLHKQMLIPVDKS